MKSEQSLIEMFSRVHGTRPFVADAEIVPFGGTNLLVSTDSFSEREDFLSGLEPEAMGRVMAYGAIADILACGAKPVFLVQAWNIDELHDERFYERVAQGIQQVVSHYGAKVVGGDIGSAKERLHRLERGGVPAGETPARDDIADGTDTSDRRAFHGSLAQPCASAFRSDTVRARHSFSQPRFQ